MAALIVDTSALLAVLLQESDAVKFATALASRDRTAHGDCFSYALARQRGEALLFKGNDFALTDVLSATQAMD